MFITGYFYCFCWSALLWSIRLLCNLLSLVLIVFMLLLLIGFVDINQLPWCSWFDVSTGVVDGFLSNFLDGVDVGIRSKMVKRNMESHWWGTRIGEERKIESNNQIILTDRRHKFVYTLLMYQSSKCLYMCCLFYYYVLLWKFVGNGRWK